MTHIPMNYTPIPDSLKSTPLLLVLKYDKAKPYYTIDKPSTAERFACTKILAWKELEPIKTSFHYYVVNRNTLSIDRVEETECKDFNEVVEKRKPIYRRLCETKEAALTVLNHLMEQRVAYYKEHLP
jgi:hypothetical protein